MISRIKDIIAYYGLSTRAFALKCGIAQNTLNRQLNGVRELSLVTVNSILDTFEEISSEWLLRGKGEMLPSVIRSDSNTEHMERLADTNVNEKIREIISYYKLSDRQFSIKIGVTQSVIGSMFQKNTEPSSKVIRLTLNAFTDISADWLLRNKGPMLLSEMKPDPNIERVERLVDTIATLQGTINKQMKTIQLLIEDNKKVRGELAILKSE